MNRKQRKRHARNLDYINHSLNNILLNQAHLYMILERIEKKINSEAPQKSTK